MGIFKDRVVLVEGKVQKFVDGVSKLTTYQDLIDITPELQRHKDKPVEKVLIAPYAPETVQYAADKAGVRIETYLPPWLKAYLASLQEYWSAAGRERRAEIFALREQFGLE